jgi:uncharacterized membrane protein YkvA (DUF1232 family)
MRNTLGRPWSELTLLANLKRRAAALKADSFALYLVARHPRTPWYAKLLAGAVVAYALSPIDLIPDFIPVLGYLDDLIIVPAGIVLAVRLVPGDVLAECRARAAEVAGDKQPVSIAAGVIIVAVWVVLAGLCVAWIARAVSGR